MSEPERQGVLAATWSDFNYWAFAEFKRSGRPREDFVWVCYPSDLAQVPEGSTLLFLHDWDRLKSPEAADRVIMAANERRLTWSVQMPDALWLGLGGDPR